MIQIGRRHTTVDFDTGDVRHGDLIVVHLAQRHAIDAHRDRFGVVPICRALSAHGIKIAPRTYWARAARPPSRRALADARITEIVAGIYEPDARGRRRPESLYGSLKMWEHLNRQGIPVARCTVERLMRAHGWRGVTRARTVRLDE